MNIKNLVREYDQLREQQNIIKKRVSELANKIKKYSAENGVKDSKGNMYLEDEDFIYGQQARKSVKLNEEKAKELFRQKDVYDLVIEKEVKEVINEDKLSELVEDEVITMEELENVTDIKVTYAIDVKKKEKEENPEDMPEVQIQNSIKKKILKKKK